LRELPAAKLLGVVDSSYTSGEPGVATSQTAATFDAFTVYAP
jgi:hypothetical protein